LAVEAVMRE
jgi:hypothetical protein